MALLFAAVPATFIVGARPTFAIGFIVCTAAALLDLAALIAGAFPASLTLPFGLAGQSTVLSLDGVSAVFLLLVLSSGAAASLAARDDHGHPMTTAAALPGFIAAMMLTLLAADAFALVAGFEAMSLASFILVVTNHRDESVQAAGRLYIGMAAWSGLCLIATVALLAPHGAGFAAMRAAPPEIWRASVILALALLGPGSKAGLVPLHIWLPAAHSAAPAPVSALMSGAMTKVALYVLIRLVFDLAGPAQPSWWGVPLIALGVASAVLGALRANMEVDLKTILACSTIENVGLITVGLGIALAARGADVAPLAGLAMGAALLHVLAHGGFKTLLFLAAGAVQYGAGSRALQRLGGLIHRMPITAGAMLLAAASLAGLPPSAGFASEWMLFQSVLGVVRLGGLAFQVMACVLAALMALATALAAAAAVRLVGVVLLGRPRSPGAAEAHEAGPPLRWAMLLGALGVMMVGLFPGVVLGLTRAATATLVHATMADRAGVFGITTATEAPGYAPLFILALLVGAAILIAAAMRARAVQGHRAAPLWGCGFDAAPVWQPHGDPLAQYAGSSFAQPLRRVLGTSLLAARETVDMPDPGDTRAAQFGVISRDPTQAMLFSPVGIVREFLSGLTDRLHFLPVRQVLTLMVAVLIGLLLYIAVVEQL
jgi:formate hydrogenlyase subunit 3/multisubunit Na+/H+ antiporter MnhD subunit